MRKITVMVLLAVALLLAACSAKGRGSAADIAIGQFEPIFVNLDAHAGIWADVDESVSAWLSSPDAQTAQTALEACEAAREAVTALIPAAPELDDGVRAAFAEADMDTLELISGYTAQQTFFDLSARQLESMIALMRAGEGGMEMTAAALEFNLGYNECEYRANLLVLNELFAPYPDSVTQPFYDGTLGKLPVLSAYLSPWEHDGETCAIRIEALVQKQTALYADFVETVGRITRELG